MPVWDISAVDPSIHNDSPTITGGTWGVCFKPDGTAFFNADRNAGVMSPATVRKYTMSTPWDLSTASLSGTTYTATQLVGSYNDIAFNDDGTKMYLLDQGGPGKIFQYTLSSGYDLSTVSYSGLSLDVSATVAGPQHLTFKPDGTKVWVTKQSTVYQFDLSTAWNISTGSYASKSYDNSGRDTQTNSTSFRDDGSRMWMIGSKRGNVASTPYIYQFDLSTPWDVTTATFTIELGVGVLESIPRDIEISPDGTKLMFCGNGSKVYRYTLGSLGRGWVIGMTLN